MPNDRLYWDDFRPGQTFELGSREVTKDEIIRFATAFDPQPFHIDEAAATRYPYGGLIASGWHTASMVMRLFVDGLLAQRAPSLGSPGVDELRWLKPVRPGDTISLKLTVVETRASQSKPDRGLVFFRHELSNQAGETVMTMRGKGFFPRRPAGETA
jgi:acyl dehydratase